MGGNQGTEWEKLAEIVPDRATLDDTFHDWEKNAEASIIMLQSREINAVPVMVTVADLQLWCKEQGRQVDGEARAVYVSHLLRFQGSGPPQ
ncbi:hypothetical protein B1C78_16205 [Thioalkalivibrio denitrificans]|uniref:Uncharacterized protein n=1 Tax=Thioalkalivibrio denitrificans TaxID=108003 RepID=A0A1V3N998_9GAMM|nr:hypothetical protein B1C78_16205 [Thioalkalivibrio denitrificans]